MPKKTKKEKIIAQYRRKLSTIREAVPMTLAATSPSPYVYQAKNSASHRVVLAVQPIDHAIRRDLIKTLILATVAIVGEVVLSVVIGK